MTTEAQTDTAPRFTHDCDKCDFLGRHGNWDLYYCYKDVFGPTVIARFGDEGSEYISGMYHEIPAISEAKTRAILMLQRKLDNEGTR